MELGYKPPFDTRLEEHVIGAMIHDPSCIGDVVEKLQSTHFYHVANQTLFEKIVGLWREDDKKVDLELMVPFLISNNFSPASVAKAAGSIVTTANIVYYCEQLKDLAFLRAAANIGKQLVEASTLRETEEIRGMLNKAEIELSRINDATIQTGSMFTMKDAVMIFHGQFEQIYYNSNSGITGIATGLRDLDALTAGLQRTDLIVIGARPAMGKTTFALQLAQNISLTAEGYEGESVAFFSLEQSTTQLIRRMVANRGLIDLSRINSGLLSDNDWEKYTMALSQLSNAKLVIDDQAGMTVHEIKAKARKIKRERGLGCIVIDYLGKIRGADSRMNRYEQVSENVRMLKDMAKELQVPVICLAQLNRNLEQRPDKRPTLADLRESGEIEQEADIIGFLYRDDYYNSASKTKSVTELIIAKHRNGPIGSIEMLFLKNFNRFENIDRKQK